MTKSFYQKINTKSSKNFKSNYDLSSIQQANENIFWFCNPTRMVSEMWNNNSRDASMKSYHRENLNRKNAFQRSKSNWLHQFQN